MLTHLKTPAAADQLGVTYNRLYDLLRFRKIAPPPRDSSGQFVWTAADLERARVALAAGRAVRHAS
jgi:hypothetical protein